MNDQTREKEKSLAELMVRIFKEPLKPFGKSLKDLEVELSDIKTELEVVTGTFTDGLNGLKKNNSVASQKRDEVLEALHTLRDEWMPTLQSSIAEHTQAGTQALDARLSESLTALAHSERCVLEALARVVEEQHSAAHTIAALPEQLKEPLQPLVESLQGLEVKLSDIKVKLERLSDIVADGLKKNEDVTKQISTKAFEALHTLRDEWMPTLQTSIAEHAQAGAQAIDARLSESLTALAHSERRVLDALTSAGEAQRSVAHSITVLPTQFSSMQGTIENTQTVMTESLRIGQALHDSLISSQAEIIGSLRQHTERLDRTQAKLQQLMITTGVFFVSILAYVGYELLHRFT